jgi:hypothetical protein
VKYHWGLKLKLNPDALENAGACNAALADTSALKLRGTADLRSGLNLTPAVSLTMDCLRHATVTIDEPRLIFDEIVKKIGLGVPVEFGGGAINGTQIQFAVRFSSRCVQHISVDLANNALAQKFATDVTEKAAVCVALAEALAKVMNIPFANLPLESDGMRACIPTDSALLGLLGRIRFISKTNLLTSNINDITLQSDGKLLNNLMDRVKGIGSIQGLQLRDGGQQRLELVMLMNFSAPALGDPFECTVRVTPNLNVAADIPNCIVAALNSRFSARAKAESPRASKQRSDRLSFHR